MSHKDYELIADALAGVLMQGGDIDEAFNDGVETAARAIAHALKQDNPRFDLNRFLLAVGITP